MADAYLSAIVGRLIPLLASPVLKEAKLCWGVKDELHNLKNTVEAIQAVLLDAEEQYSKNHQVQFWVDSLKPVLYDAEDLLDDLSTRELQKKVMTGNKSVKEVRLFLSGSNYLLFSVKMAHKIKDIRSKLVNIVENRKLFLDLERSEKREMMVDYQEREAHSSLPEIVIGRGDDKEAIIEFLLSSHCDENVPIISVVGLGGLGKTTLAQLVVNDQKVKSHFKLQIWVSVTNDFNIKVIVEKILESIDGVKPGGNYGLDALKNRLHEKINGKRYLLVLDDVWNEDYNKWFDFRDLLIGGGGGSGSRIIVTTCLKNVAEGIRSERVYELQGLSDVDSWSLFKTMAFKQGEVESLEHEQIGKEIVAMCGGVPLALKAIGRVLYLKKTIFEWKSFKDGELANVVKETGSILPTLMLSYNHLPSHLKCCFAYCSLYPKGAEIFAKPLVEQWVAHGYVRVLGLHQNLEDVGLQYFKDLLWRSFFQEVEEDRLGSIRCFKMHDLMSDLAKEVARDEICLLSSNAECVNVKERTLHLSIDSDILTWKQLERVLHDSREVRTFHLFNGSMNNEIKEAQLEIIFSSIRSLRVLDLCDFAIKRFLPSIAKLKRLRYLDVRRNKALEFLPNSLTELRNLQSLNLTNCKRLKQLPKHMKKMINLRHLYNEGCVSLTRMPRGLGQLTSLQSLRMFVVSKDIKNGGLDELHDLNNLRGDLRIYNLQYVKNAKSEFEAANMKEKQHLEYLELSWKWKFGAVNDCDPQDDKEEISLEELQPHKNLKWLVVFGCGKLKFPNWVSTLSNLVTLHINNCNHCPLFPPLDEFPFLKRLVIANLTDLEYIANVSRISRSALFFPSLGKLWLENCPNLKGWRDAQSLQFHCLIYLDITSCPNLISMPSIPTVEALAVQNTNASSVEQIVQMKISVLQSTSSSPSSSVSPTLSQLESLALRQIEGIESLPEKFMQNLTSLQNLQIVDCPGMKTLPSAIQHLTSLKVLILGDFEDLDFSDEDNEGGLQWTRLRSLEVIQFENLKKLASLPKGIQRVPNLRQLVILSCPNLIYLPDWIANLNGLQELNLENCPHLRERFSNNSGTDWTKIEHIPNIQVNGKWIQMDSHTLD